MGGLVVVGRLHCILHVVCGDCCTLNIPDLRVRCKRFLTSLENLAKLVSADNRDYLPGHSCDIPRRLCVGLVYRREQREQIQGKRNLLCQGFTNGRNMCFTFSPPHSEGVYGCGHELAMLRSS